MPTSVGAMAGASLSVMLSAEHMSTVLAVAMIAMLVVVLVQPKRFVGEPARSRWATPALVLAGIYGGFLQAGVGIALLLCLVLLGGLDAVKANAMKLLLTGVFTLPALAIYAWADLLRWAPGLALAAGGALGAVAGAKLTMAGGAPLVRGALIAILAATAIRLLWPGA